MSALKECAMAGEKWCECFDAMKYLTDENNTFLWYTVRRTDIRLTEGV